MPNSRWISQKSGDGRAEWPLLSRSWKGVFINQRVVKGVEGDIYESRRVGCREFWNKHKLTYNAHWGMPLTVLDVSGQSTVSLQLAPRSGVPLCELDRDLMGWPFGPDLAGIVGTVVTIEGR